MCLKYMYKISLLLDLIDASQYDESFEENNLINPSTMPRNTTEKLIGMDIHINNICKFR